MMFARNPGPAGFDCSSPTCSLGKHVLTPSTQHRSFVELAAKFATHPGPAGVDRSSPTCSLGKHVLTPSTQHRSFVELVTKFARHLGFFVF